MNDEPADLILAYKIIFGLIDMATKEFFTLRHKGFTRGHAYTIVPEHSRIDARKYFFFANE
jgi:hypothetical protein